MNRVKITDKLNIIFDKYGNYQPEVWKPPGIGVGKNRGKPTPGGFSATGKYYPTIGRCLVHCVESGYVQKDVVIEGELTVGELLSKMEKHIEILRDLSEKIGKP